MDTKSITAVIIGLMVSGLILVAFVPIFTEVTATEKTFTNDGYFYMQKLSASDESVYTLEYSYDSDTAKLSYEYNGEAVDTSGWPVSPLNVTLATDGETWIVRASPNNEYVGMQAVGYGFAFGGHNIWTVSIEFDSGTVTATVTNSGGTSSTYTATYTDLWLYSPTPTDYVMKKANVEAYMLDDSEYLAVGITSMTAWNTGIKIEGDMDDFTATIIYPPNLTTTVTNKAIVSEEVTSYVHLNKLDKLTFTINDGTTTVDATYSYFIVPSKVTAELSVHGDDAFNAIINIIPLLAGVGLLMAGVYYFISRK